MILLINFVVLKGFNISATFRKSTHSRLVTYFRLLKKYIKLNNPQYSKYVVLVEMIKYYFLISLNDKLALYLFILMFIDG